MLQDFPGGSVLKTLPFRYRDLNPCLGKIPHAMDLGQKKVLQSISFNESKISNNELVTVILESHWRRRCVYNTYECIDIFVYIYRGLSRWDNGKVSA